MDGSPGIEDESWGRSAAKEYGKGVNVNRQCYRNRESLEIGEVEGGMYMDCHPEADGISSDCKTTEDNSGTNEDGNIEVMLYFGGPDMILYGVSFHNDVTYYAMYGTE